MGLGENIFIFYSFKQIVECFLIFLMAVSLAIYDHGLFLRLAYIENELLIFFFYRGVCKVTCPQMVLCTVIGYCLLMWITQPVI